MSMEWITLVTTLIATLPAILIALGTLVVAWRTNNSITVLKEHVNSKMDKLLEVTGDAERAKGNLAGREEQRIEQESGKSE